MKNDDSEYNMMLL